MNQCKCNHFSTNFLAVKHFTKTILTLVSHWPPCQTKNSQNNSKTFWNRDSVKITDEVEFI